MRYDYGSLYRKNHEFYASRPWAVLALKIANLVLSVAFFVAYGAATWHAASALGAEEIAYGKMMRMLGAPLFCLLVVTVLRYAVNRPRPYSEAGANITPLLQKHGNADKSFPSRHLASAFVIAITLLPFYPVVSYCILPFAFLLGYIRFALGLHYPSDLFGGAILGTLCGLLVYV